MIRKLKQLIFILFVCTYLTGCYDAPSATNSVNASTPQDSYVAALGKSMTVPVTFATDTGTADNLSITNLTDLPHGWSVQGSSAFNCKTVTTNGANCQLNLTFAPTNINQDNGFLSLNYNYINSAGQNRNATFSVAYNAILGYTYIANSVFNEIRQCVLNSDGTFGTCSLAGKGFDEPQGIAFYTAGNGKTFAYITNFNSTTVSQCPINNDGTFGTCTIAGNEFNLPNNIVFETVNGTTFAYVLDDDPGTINKCSLNNDGTFGICTVTGGNRFDYPVNIDFQPVNDPSFVYITNSNSNIVDRCPVNDDGSFGACTLAASGFNEPVDIAFRTAKNGENFAYITNHSILSQCPVNNDGTLGTCTSTGSKFLFPANIVFKIVNGISFAYVTSLGNEIDDPGRVTQCSINNDGTFGICTITGDGFHTPIGIAFN